MSNVHPAAAVGFDRAAAAYERGRASYSAAAIDAILAVAGAARGRTLLELGAGTGKLTRELVASGARVVALEPVAGMREVLAQTAPGAEPLEAVPAFAPLELQTWPHLGAEGRDARRRRGRAALGQPGPSI